MVGSASLPLHNGNVHTYISFVLTYDESLWTLTKRGIIRVRTQYDSACWTVARFYFWNCGTFDIPRSMVSRVYQEYYRSPWTGPMLNHGSLMIMTKGDWIELSEVTNKQHCSKSHSLQDVSDTYPVGSFVSMEYGSRRSTKTFLWTPWQWTQHPTSSWCC